jgi:hypothetical protein
MGSREDEKPALARMPESGFEERMTQEVEIEKYGKNTLFLRESVGECVIESGPDKGKKVEITLNANHASYIFRFPDKTYVVNIRSLMDAILAARAAEAAYRAGAVAWAAFRKNSKAKAEAKAVEEAAAKAAYRKEKEAEK